jgi:hypothetical protein
LSTADGRFVAIAVSPSGEHIDKWFTPPYGILQFTACNLGCISRPR